MNSGRPYDINAPQWPPHRVELLSDLELAHAKAIVHDVEIRNAFARRFPKLPWPVPESDEAMVARLVEDDDFTRVVELDFAAHVVAVAEGTEQPTPFERERAEQHRRARVK